MAGRRSAPSSAKLELCLSNLRSHPKGDLYVATYLTTALHRIRISFKDEDTTTSFPLIETRRGLNGSLLSTCPLSSLRLKSGSHSIVPYSCIYSNLIIHLSISDLLVGLFMLPLYRSDFRPPAPDSLQWTFITIYSTSAVKLSIRRPAYQARACLEHLKLSSSYYLTDRYSSCFMFLSIPRLIVSY